MNRDSRDNNIISSIDQYTKDAHEGRYKQKDKLHNHHKHNKRDKHAHSDDTVLTPDKKSDSETKFQNKYKNVVEEKKRKLIQQTNNQITQHNTQGHDGDNMMNIMRENRNKEGGRVFLWHKDTEATPFDERLMSAAYYDDLKIITYSKTGQYSNASFCQCIN